MRQLRETYIPAKLFYTPRIKPVLHRLGYYTKLSEIDSVIIRRVHKVYGRGDSLVDPIIEWILVSRDDFPNRSASGRILLCPYVFAWSATLGHSIDDSIERDFFDQKPFEGSLLDAWGSEAVEAMANAFDKAIRKAVDGRTLRESPGFNGVSPSENAQILALIGSKHVAADNRSGILSPKKSVVCVMGCGPDAAHALSHGLSL